MGHVAIPYKWKEFVTSILRDSSLDDEKASKEDRPACTHLSTRSGTIQTKKGLAMTHSKWKNAQDAVNWINLARVQDERLRFW